VSAYWDVVMIDNPSELNVTKDANEVTKILSKYHEDVLVLHPIDPTIKLGETEKKEKENKRCLAPLASWIKIWEWKIGTGEG